MRSEEFSKEALPWNLHTFICENFRETPFRQRRQMEAETRHFLETLLVEDPEWLFRRFPHFARHAMTNPQLTLKVPVGDSELVYPHEVIVTAYEFLQEMGTRPTVREILEKISLHVVAGMIALSEYTPR